MSDSASLQQLEADAIADGPLESTRTTRKGVIHYLCLQATREGQASHAHVHEIIRGLEVRGWEVQLFEPRYALDQRPIGIAHKLLEFVALQLRMWFDPVRPDLIYVRDHIGLLPSYAWARSRRIPVVAEINGSFADYTVAHPSLRAVRPLIVATGRSCLRLADFVIAASPKLCEWVQSEIGSKRTAFIPNGANTTLFRPDAVAGEHEALGKYVTFVGAFAPWQGIGTMLEAIEHPEWPRDVKLVIIGSGHEQPRVERAAAENSRVVYLGRKSYRDVPGILAGGLAGISAQTNPGGRTEGGIYPLKVFETLACGIPAIVTDFPGQSELVLENGCGLVIPQGDPASLARAVAYLWQHPTDREAMGGRGRKIVEERYSWQHSADTTETVIHQVLGR